MPIYEYKCNDCGNIFEILTTSSDDAEKIQCSKCKSEKVNKVISAGSFKLSSGIAAAISALVGLWREIWIFLSFMTDGFRENPLSFCFCQNLAWKNHKLFRFF